MYCNGTNVPLLRAVNMDFVAASCYSVQSERSLLKIMMASPEDPVEVCVCGGSQQHLDATLLLHRLAAGDMLGPAQTIRLTLTNDADRHETLAEMAWDLNDACYPLLKNVRTDTDLTHSFSSADFLLLLVPDISDDRQLLKRYSSALNGASGTGYKAVVLAGQNASAAAGVLKGLAPHLSGRLLLAIDTPGFSSSHAQHGGYRLAQTVCNCVKQWWTGVQESENLVLGVGFHGIVGIPHGCVLPVPVSVTAPLTASVEQDAEKDWKSIATSVRSFVEMARCLGLDEADILRSCVEAKL